MSSYYIVSLLRSLSEKVQCFPGAVARHWKTSKKNRKQVTVWTIPDTPKAGMNDLKAKSWLESQTPTHEGLPLTDTEWCRSSEMVGLTLFYKESTKGPRCSILRHQSLITIGENTGNRLLVSSNRRFWNEFGLLPPDPVSYTHLTLPTT